MVASVRLAFVLLLLCGPATAQTRVELPDGRAIWLDSGWTPRAELWPDAAVVFRGYSRDLLVLDGGEREPRLIWKYPHRAQSWLSGSTWSADGSHFYCWLDHAEQLVAIELDSGRRTSLTMLPTRVWNLKGDQHIVERPVRRRGGVVESPSDGVLLFLLDEEFSDEIPFWQRRDVQGGNSLVTLRPGDGSMVILAPKCSLPETILSWDLSIGRSLLFVVSKSRKRGIEAMWALEARDDRVVEERRLNGELVRTLVESGGDPGDIALSPDERILLVERRYKPGSTPPAGSLWSFKQEDFAQLRRAEHGGFVLIDLESGESGEGPRSGNKAAWCPDGQTIAYVDEWDVKLHDVVTGVETLLVKGWRNEPDSSYGTWHEASWSPDGRRLALTTWAAGQALLLDVAQQEYFILEADASEVSWAPVAKPFAGH